MSAKKKQEPKNAPPAEDSLIMVEVINQPIYEAGVTREKGTCFETTAARADALRHFVKILPPC